jgi:hypothetical protein
VRSFLDKIIKLANYCFCWPCALSKKPTVVGLHGLPFFRLKLHVVHA